LSPSPNQRAGSPVRGLAPPTVAEFERRNLLRL
jgi:hypothetical protein